MRYAVRCKGGAWLYWHAKGPKTGYVAGRCYIRKPVGEDHMGSVHADAKGIAERHAEQWDGKVVRILSHEEALRRREASTWRAAAERLQDAVDGLRADGSTLAADWVAEHVRAYLKTADELWPAPKKRAGGKERSGG